MQKPLPPAGGFVPNPKPKPKGESLRRKLFRHLRHFILRPWLIGTAVVLITIGGLLWVLSGLNILSSSWSVSLASSFTVIGVLLTLAQYAVPLSASLTDDQVYEIYRKQIKSTMFGRSGAVLIRTKGLRNREIYALYLTGRELLDIADEGLQSYIINEVLFTRTSTYQTKAQETALRNRSIEIATFSGLKPGQYIFWPHRVSVPKIEEAKNQSHYAYEEVISGQVTEIDWRYPYGSS